MKLFKRSAKESAVLDPADNAPAKRPASAGLGGLLPGLACGIIGLGAAGALLWFGLQASQQAHYSEVARAWGQSQVSALDQALKQLAADTRSLASDPRLAEALRSDDPERAREAERDLARQAGVLDAHLYQPDRASPRPGRAGPVNFAALDLLQRAENGDNPAPEAYRIGDQWLLYSAVALQTAAGGQAGTLLVVSPLDRVLGVLPRIPADAGQLRITQQFSKGPAQLLTQSGHGGAEEQALTLPASNPNWSVRFAPAQQSGTAGMSPLLLAGALLAALCSLLLALQLTLGRQQRQLREDVLRMGQMLQELSRGKTIQTPTLSLPALDALARSLVRLPLRSATPPEPPKAPTPAPAAAPQGKPYVDPKFQDTDILDIDILDEDQDWIGLESKERESAMSPKAPQLPASIFRAYDIRGVVGDSLTTETAYWVGRAVGSESLAKGEPNVSVGRDGRLSGPELVEHLIQGLVDSGCTVSDVGMVPTPVLYYAANVLAGKSGVMLTGSHNPPDYNGFKIVIAGDTLANEQIQALRLRIENNDLSEGVGLAEKVDILDGYFKRIREDIALAKPMKVVVDCGNGVAGVIAPQLIEALGCKVIPLFCDVDGNFPNHHPDPGKLENLEDLIAKVRSENADLGLAFDGDGDRVGVVTNAGTVVYPDRLLMLFAKDVVSRNPGADIIFDVKCTRRLTPLISGYGGRPVMWKTGHSLIKKKMKETGALLAGEMSGHIFFKERWYGFDDGIYSAARLLEILSQDKRSSEQVFASFPNDLSTPEINITVTEESKFKIIETLQRDAHWGDASVTTLDGLRVDYPKGWGLVRASNTTPVLVLRFEAESEDELKRIQEVFRAQLYTVAPDLNLPF